MFDTQVQVPLVGSRSVSNDAYDWAPWPTLDLDDNSLLDPESGRWATEDEEMFGDPWSAFLSGCDESAVAAEPTQSDDPWVGVSKVSPRSLPGVTGLSGPRLADRLEQVELERLSPAQLVEAMTGAERLSRWAQAVQLAAVKAFADYAVVTDDEGRDNPLVDLPGGRHVVEVGFGTQREIQTFCSDGIGAALGTSFTAAQQLIEAAYFSAAVPTAAAMHSEGVLDTPRLKVLARELAPVGYDTPEDRAVVDRLISEATELTPRKLQVRARTAVMEHRPDGENEAHERELENRSVWVNRKPSGMATLCAYLSAEEAQLAYQALNGAAVRRHDAEVDGGTGKCAEPHKSYDNRRADALMDALGVLHQDLLGRESGAGLARVMLHLYMQGSTLAGHDNHPAQLLGYGPLSADQARELAEDAALTRILTDPFSGEIKAIDLAAYRVPKILRAALQGRDRTCVFPGCDVPAYDTQIDHILPHAFARRLQKALATGRTTFSNLQSLCVRHHYLKTHGGWTVQSTRGARLEWISPTGHSYRRNAEWGPPREFWPDHDRRVPVDEPRPPSAIPSDSGRCPF